MRYIYSDETIFAGTPTCIGVGMLISDSEIALDLIQEALDNLIKDKDRFKEQVKKQDDNTISRGYFHACDDSKNAHSHLCDQINKINNAEFESIFFKWDKQPLAKQNERYLFRQSTVLSSVAGTHTPEDITFTLEKRKGLSRQSVEEMYNGLKENVLFSVYDLPFIPYFFPKITFEIADKNNSGLQCADFLLWTVNRNLNGDKTWFNRIKALIKTGFTAGKESWGSHHMQLGAGLKEPNRYYTIDDFPKNPDVNKNMLIHFFIHAAKVVEYYFYNPLPHISHLQQEAVVKNKKNTQFPDYFKKLSSAYLMLFDMVPIINNSTSVKDKEFLLLSKKYMGLLLRRDLQNCMATLMFLNTARKDIIQNNQAMLEF